MDATVRQHIERLGHRLEALGLEVMVNGLDQEARNRVEAEIRAAKTALEHYRAALEIENSLSSSN